MIKSKQKGFSLVEILLAIGIFSLIIVMLSGIFLQGEEGTFLAGNRSRAVFFAEEGIEAVRNIKENDFENIDLSDGTYYLELVSNEWELTGAEDLFDIFSREIVLDTIDGNTKEVTSRVSWQQNQKRTGVVEILTRFTNWLESIWTESSEVEFLAGYINSTEVTNNSGGEIQLGREASWGDPGSYLSYDMTGNQDPVDIFMQDNILWVARSDGNLYKYDISDISNGNITEEEVFSIGQTPVAFSIKGDFAYVATTGNLSELVIIDLLSVLPNTNIDLLGLDDPTDVFVFDDRVFVSRTSLIDYDLYVLSLSGSTQGVFEVTGNIYAITADEDYAYLATSNNNELWIIDYNNCSGGLLSNECSLVNQYSLIDGGNQDATAIYLSGDNLYIGRDQNYIHSIDVSNVNSISENLSINSGNDYVTDIYTDENNGYIFATTNDSVSTELNIIEISSGNVTTYNMAGSSVSSSVWKQGSFVYLLSQDNSNEIQVIKTSTGGFGNITLQDIYDTDGVDDANDVFVLGNYAYLGTDDDFWVFDVSDPMNITYQDMIDFNYDIQDVFVSGNYAYLATENNTSELVIVNVTDPTNISIAGTFNIDGNEDAMSVWVSGNNAYVGTVNNNGSFSNCANSEFYILNISNPASVSCLGSYDVGDHVLDIQVEGNDAYLGTASNTRELLILNITNSASITQRSFYNMAGNSSVNAVYVDTVNNLTYAGQNGGLVWAFNTANPSSILLEGNIDIGDNIRDIKGTGVYLFVATDDNNESLEILNVGNVTNGVFTTVSTYDANGDCNGLHFDGTNIHMACEDNLREYIIVGPEPVPDTYSYEGWFRSGEHDTGISNITWDSISWSESGSGEIKFQLRTAPDSGGSPGTWTRWLGPSGVDDYYTDNLGGDPINSVHSDGSSDQWIQYQGSFTGNGASTPILEDISIIFN